MVRPGDVAPPLCLKGVQDGVEQEYALEGAPGHPLVLAFYPGDETPTCTKQLCTYSDNLEDLEALGAEVWGISPQDLASHTRFAAKRGLRMPLLADTDKAAAKAYGVLGPLGLYRRSVFVVDAEGRIAWSHVAAVGLTYRSVEEISAALRALQPAG